MGAHSLIQRLTPERRAWIYDTLTATLPLVAAFGFITTGQMQMWTMFAAAVLGYGANYLASKNVSPGPRDGNPNPEYRG